MAVSIARKLAEFAAKLSLPIPVSLGGTGVGTLQALKDLLGVKQVFVSAEQTLTTSARIDVAHGFGELPADANFFVTCKVAEGGYSVGDTVKYTGRVLNSSNAELGTTASFDATNVWVRQPTIWAIHHKTTGAGFQLTPANWRGIITATSR